MGCKWGLLWYLSRHTVDHCGLKMKSQWSTAWSEMMLGTTVTCVKPHSGPPWAWAQDGFTGVYCRGCDGAGHYFAFHHNVRMQNMYSGLLWIVQCKRGLNAQGCAWVLCMICIPMSDLLQVTQFPQVTLSQVILSWVIHQSWVWLRTLPFPIWSFHTLTS